MNPIAMIHPSLNKMGGAEKMAIEIIKILELKGYPVHLYTIDKTNWEKIEQRWEISRPNKEQYYQEQSLNPENLYTWVKNTLQYMYILIKTHIKYQISINNYGEALPYLSEITFFHAEPIYKHRENPYNIPFWTYFRPVYTKVAGRIKSSLCNGYFVSNSKYNAQIIEDRFEKKTIVIYPFINPLPYIFGDKNGQILTVSRLTSSKNLDIIPSIMSITRKYPFHIMGQRTTSTDRVLNNLRSNNKLKISINPTKKEIIQNMLDSTIILSTQKNEAFGLAILEAMSSGCIPIIPKNGGPWYDIFEERESDIGFAYETPTEAAKYIIKILTNEELRHRLRLNSIKRAQNFNFYRYSEDIIKLLENTMENPPEKTCIYYWFYQFDEKIHQIKKKIADYINQITQDFNRSLLLSLRNTPNEI